MNLQSWVDGKGVCNRPPTHPHATPLHHPNRNPVVAAAVVEVVLDLLYVRRGHHQLPLQLQWRPKKF